MLAAVHLVTISVETDDATPYLRIVWDDPKTGERRVMVRLSLGTDSAAENNRALNLLADQILSEHLEDVHLVQAKCEEGMRHGNED